LFSGKAPDLQIEQSFGIGSHYLWSQINLELEFLIYFKILGNSTSLNHFHHREREGKLSKSILLRIKIQIKVIGA
jgi:hypothetical protein